MQVRPGVIQAAIDNIIEGRFPEAPRMAIVVLQGARAGARLVSWRVYGEPHYFRKQAAIKEAQMILPVHQISIGITGLREPARGQVRSMLGECIAQSIAA